MKCQHGIFPKRNCDICLKAHMKAYRQRPEVKARIQIRRAKTLAILPPELAKKEFNRVWKEVKEET
jgi:hypothetical protein